jgi:hypothetical protein
MEIDVDVYAKVAVSKKKISNILSSWRGNIISFPNVVKKCHSVVMICYLLKTMSFRMDQQSWLQCLFQI